MDKTIPFPQADDISKIKKIISISEEALLSDTKRLQILLGDITERQVQYYLSAAMFLGLLENKKSFSEYGKLVRSLNEYEQDISLCQRIVSKEVFGEVYFSELVLGILLEKDEVIAIMKKKVAFNSQEIYRRRAQTVMKWVEWVRSKDSLHSSVLE